VVGPQRRSPEGASAEEDAARRSLPEAKRGKGPERGARTERTMNTVVFGVWLALSRLRGGTLTPAGFVRTL